MNKKTLIFLPILFLIVGCFKSLPLNSVYFDTTGRPFLSKQNSGPVQIIQGEIKDSHREIGSVEVYATSDVSREEIDKEMAARAAENGADAVIQVKYTDENPNKDNLFSGLMPSGKKYLRAAGKAIIFDAS